MSKPSFSNIDLWLFEYAEGNLTADQEAQLELFILQHPELDVERDMWDMAKVETTPTPYPETESLYRRKPVGMYIGAGVMALLLLLFTGYAITTPSEDEQARPVANQGHTVVHNASHLSTEQQLRDEIADLKTLVASLENELHDSRGVVSSSNTLIVSNGQEATQTIVTPFPGVAAGNLGQTGVDAVNTRNSQVVTTQNTAENTGIMAPQMTVSSPTVATTVGNTAADPEGQTLDPLAPENFSGNDDLTLKETLTPTLSEEMELSEQHFSVDNEMARKVRTSTYQQMSSNYDYSFKYRMSKWAREFQRMMDNPIALKNSRDPYYHVPGLSTTDLNFGVTGTLIAPRIQTMSRLQWFGQPNELMTNQIGLDAYAYALRGGIGMQMTHQYYANGGIQNSTVAFTYSPKISVSRKISVEPAIRFKMGNKLLDASRMEGQARVEMMPGNVIDYYTDGSEPVGRLLWYKDLGLGMNINTEWFYVSAQVDNMFRHRDNIYSNASDNKRRSGTHFVATIGTDWESKKNSWETKKADFGLSPYLVYQKYEDINELWAGANFRAHWFSLGAAISSNLDPAASIGVIGPGKHFSLMYNVDYMQSAMTGNRTLSHQLTLRFVGKPNRAGQRFLNQ